MKLTHLLSLAILIVFNFQTANSLRCYNCADIKCKVLFATTCPERQVCLSVDYKIGNEKFHIKGCSLQALCTQPPSFVPSGSSYSQTCCDRDLCNSAITNQMSLLSAGLLALVSLYVSRL